MITLSSNASYDYTSLSVSEMCLSHCPLDVVFALHGEVTWWIKLN